MGGGNINRVLGNTYLAEVRGALVVINLLTNLLVPRERMHDDHVALGVLEDRVINNEAVLQALVLGLIVKAFALDAGAVDDVGVGNHLLGQSGGLLDDHALGGEDIADLTRELETGRSSELDLDTIVLEEVREGMNGAAVLEITSKGDGQVVDRSKLLTDGEEIEEGLSRVLLGTVA